MIGIRLDRKLQSREGFLDLDNPEQEIVFDIVAGRISLIGQSNESSPFGDSPLL